MTSKEIISLFKGIGIIIDENINNANSHDDILKIYKYFIQKQIPILTYSSLPEDGVIQNFRDVNFIVLDWNLHNHNPIPLALIDDNLHFIEKVNQVCFTPIFIFTNEDSHEIEIILQERGLFFADRPNNIFVKSKSEIRSGRILFSEIAKWVKRTPPVYVMKQWDCNTRKATSDLFHDLHKISPDWTYIMVKTYNEDVGTENAEIGNFLFSNMMTTCAPLILDNQIIHKTRTKVDKEELRQLLEREKYIGNNKLMRYPALGDIFKEGRNYYFIFRPDCDLVRQDNPEIYLVKGKTIKEKDIIKRNSYYKFHKGAFLDRVDSSVVPFIDNGKIVVFEFKKLRCGFWKDYADKRIGRLLPPYSLRLKSQLMGYLQRQALPSIPEIAIK